MLRRLSQIYSTFKHFRKKKMKKIHKQCIKVQLTVNWIEWGRDNRHHKIVFFLLLISHSTGLTSELNS